MDWKTEFQNWLEERGQSPNTIKGYMSDITAFVAWIAAEYDEQFSIAHITSRDLRSYRRYVLHDKKVAGATWNRYRVALKNLCDYAYESGVLSQISFEGVDMVESSELAPRWLTKKEFGKFMRVVDRESGPKASEFIAFTSLRDRAMVYLMMFCGLRVDEVASLDLKDIYFTDRKGTVRVLGKGEKEAKIPLNYEVRNQLHAYIGMRGFANGPLFTAKGSERCSVKTIQRVVSNFGKVAGMDDITPHRLRHTCAKRLLDAGVPVTTVQKVLRHSRLDTTARYLLPSQEDIAEALEKL